MVRSKSEGIIANLPHEREMPFRYGQPLYAGDGTLRLQDFTVVWNGQTFFREHPGRLAAPGGRIGADRPHHADPPTAISRPLC